MPRHEETVALRKAEPRRIVVADEAVTAVLPVTTVRPDSQPEPEPERDTDPGSAATGGRAERRRAAKGAATGAGTRSR